jgi:PhoPQ-activated pathogenicity-related protein
MRESPSEWTERSTVARYVGPDTGLIVTCSLLVQSGGKRWRDKRELAGHQSLDEVHGNGKVGRVQSTAILGVSEIPIGR